MTENDFGRQLQGSWVLVRAELGGEPMPREAAARVEIHFDTQGGYRVRFAGEITDQGRFILLTAASTDDADGAESGSGAPQQIALWGEVGANARRRLPGIAQLRGDRLRLCLALEGTAAPHEFSSRAGTAHYLATYKRSGH